jgi:predicted benzoate:H+ symporter BenE
VRGAPEVTRRDALSRILSEANGAFGDFGIFLSYVVGALSLGALSAQAVLFGFGSMLIGSGLLYGIPMAVQPMKAVAAAILTAGLSASEIATVGLLLGATFLVLGLTGGIAWLARAIPQSVISGLQLGLGASLALLGTEMIVADPLLGVLMLTLCLLAMRVTLLPLLPLAALATLVAVLVERPDALALSPALPSFVPPSVQRLPELLEIAVIPQIPLTVTNAILVTAAVGRDLFPHRGTRASARNLALTTGFGNLLLAPFGALPMCHGAGGVVAQRRFGARSGLAPIFLGVLFLGGALLFGESAQAVLSAVPLAAAGGLLVVAGVDLALSKRLFDARADCWPAILGTALATILFQPAVGLLAGLAVEFLRKQVAAKRRKG